MLLDDYIPQENSHLITSLQFQSMSHFQFNYSFTYIYIHAYKKSLKAEKEVQETQSNYITEMKLSFLVS